MFTPGRSGNPAGRPQGAKDKAQANIKLAYQSLVEGNLTNIERWLDEVATKDPAKAIELMIKISEFIVPKMKTVDFKNESEDKRPMFIFQDISGKEIENPCKQNN